MADAKKPAKAATKKKAPSAAAGDFVSKKFNDHTITKKRASGYIVKTLKGALVKGADKAKILLESGVLKPNQKSTKKAEATT